MSTLVKSPPGIEKSADFWVDVEVPYNKIVDKWSEKYRQRMVGHMENNRLQRRVFSIYFTMLGRREIPQDRIEALDFLYEKRESWVYNLCSQFEFSNGLSESLIIKFAEEIESDLVDYGLQEEYRSNLGDDETPTNKDGLVALCQLVRPNSLKDMLIYHRYSNRSPTNLYKRESGQVPNKSNWNGIIKRLSENKVEDYDIWHQFELGDELFVAIEQEDRDGVERQVGNNIEEEPANLVILHFDGEYLDIYADNRSTANASLIGVNEDVDGDDYEEDRNEVGSKQVGKFTKEVVNRDKERDQQSTEEDHEYVMTDLWVSRTKLPNKPGMKLHSEGGVGRAVEKLKEEGYDLLADNQKIEKIKIRFEGWKFTITPAKNSDNTGRKYTELVYNCSADTETREKFESIIQDEFGIDMKYKFIRR